MYSPFDKVIAYLDELLVIAPFEIKKSTVLDWIAYNRKVGNYDSIITKIDELLGQSDFSIIHIKSNKTIMVVLYLIFFQFLISALVLD